MPDYRKSYKKSKNSKNSKSGGRRRKHTMRKYRRGRNVMRRGGGPGVPANPKVTEPVSKNFLIEGDDGVKAFLTNSGIDIPENIDNITYTDLLKLINDVNYDTGDNFKLKFPFKQTP